ncbi:hypothetical protein DYB37_000215 [Aphanomyces astaci]|uniref:Helicase C-terminal domain-containing protein n=1 Tax=Aphanomyces astaci TaxID=112090 RepID=A0A3R7AXW6_APHAT|nr:hypothetical protein DYB37_000215 [Aphanomyces astaci]
MLIFMPGVQEIKSTIRELQQSKVASALVAYPLHGALPGHEQSRVFDGAPKGKTKVIVSTNVAETSITIDDIVVRILWIIICVVIDVGKAKEMAYDAINRRSILAEQWVSQAAADQRKGRFPFLVRPGVCYRLFSTKQFHKMAPQPTPEIHRVSLEPLCLQIQALELGPIDTFLANVPALSSKSPFVSAPDDRSKGDALKKQWSDQVPTSDHFLLWTVVKTFSALSKSLRRSYCKDNCLSYETLATIVDLRQQYLEHCQMLGFYDPSNAARFNQHSANPKVIKAALTAGLYGNVLQVVYPEQKYYESANGVLAAAHDAKAIRFFIRKLDKTTERVFIHPSSSQFESPWLVYNELVQTSKIFVRESTMVAPYALLLFGGELTVQHEKVQLFRWQPWTKCRYVQGLLHVDGWIKFHAVARIGVLVKALRHQLDHLLAVKVTDPSVDLSSSHLIDAICDLLITEGV